MDTLLIGLLGTLLSTNRPAVLSHWFNANPAVAASGINRNDPVEVELRRIMQQDDDAQDEIDRWIKDNKKFEEKKAGLGASVLSFKVEQRLDVVKSAYLNFLQRHPNHARARLAYGTFLDDQGREEEAQTQFEKALESDPKNPACWNNLANVYGHRGPVKKAFEYYHKAIELNPREPTYFHNLATTVYLFRKDAMEHYQVDEARVFEHALELYRIAVGLAPKDFNLATDYAQTYYGIKPLRVEAALKAWNYALTLAHDDVERQGAYLHLARVMVLAGRFDEARQNLEKVTQPMYKDLRVRVERMLQKKQGGATDLEPIPIK